MKKIVLFGAGDLLANTYNYVNKINTKIIAIVDNDERKWGSYFKGIKITSPERLKSLNFDYVFISNVTYRKEITAQLRKMGIRKIIPIYAKEHRPVECKVIQRHISIVGRLSLEYGKYKADNLFNPRGLSLLINPYYFSRRGLYKAIKDNRKYITGKCLDFGCGIKPYRELFDVKEYVGVEIMGEYANDDIVYYDGYHIPFNDNEFDSLICSQVIEHIPNLDEVVGELYRVLKPGAVCLITMPFIYPEHMTPYDFRRFTSYGINNYFSERGFEIISFIKTGGAVETLAQMNSVYLNEVLFDNKNLTTMKTLFTAGINISGVLLNRFLKKDDNLYLDNVIILRKI